MSRRAASTLILITRQDLVRADFSSGPNPVLQGFWGQARPELPDNAALVEAALANGAKPGKEVWVLSADLWTQTLTLPAARTTGLSQADLATALNFEAEGLSGQSAFDATVSFVPLSSGGRANIYWITQIRTADRDMVDDTISKAGSRLAGIIHPAGIPRPLTAFGRKGSSWQRAELWPDVVVCVNGQGQVHVVNSAPQLGQWQVEWQQWRGVQASSGQEEFLTDVGVASPTAPSESLVTFEDETALQGWLSTWAAVLSSKNPSVPILRPAPRPLTASQRRNIAFALTLASLAICFGINAWLNAAFENTELAIKAAEAPRIKIAELQKSTKELDTKIADLKKKRESALGHIEHLTLQRQRLIRLVECFARMAHEDLIVQKIENIGGEPRIHGISLQPALVDQLASKLALVLPEHGWHVEAPARKNQPNLPGGGPCTFTMQFRAMTWSNVEQKFSMGKGEMKITVP